MINPHGQVLPAVFVNHGQHPEDFAIVRSILDKVIGPDMISIFGSLANTGPVIEPESASFWLFLWDL